MSGHQLEAWAVALNAHSDDDAVATLTRLVSRLDQACDDLDLVRGRLADAPTEADSSLSTSIGLLIGTMNELVSTRDGFLRHERG